ncbi:MAG: WYL domain-containing protein [Lysobacteraceae bacterium]
MPLLAPDFHVGEANRWLGELRGALRNGVQIEIGYQDAQAQSSRRRIDPLGLFFWGDRWSLVGWCHLRADFRHFRLDRIQTLRVCPENVTTTAERSLAEYLRRVRADVPGA